MAEVGNQNLCTSLECSCQLNCCQQLNLSNSEMISPTVIDTINKSITLSELNFMYDCDIEVKSDITGHILGVGQINCKIRSSKPIHSLGESELSENIERGLKQTLKDKVEKSLKNIFAKLKSLDSAEEIERTELNAMLQDCLLTQESLPSSPVIRIAADIGGTSVRAIVDTGASRSHVSEDVYLKMKANNPAWIKDLADKYNLTIKGASGQYITTLI